ncbi:MAG: DUF3568 family protein [Opitutaceae bacterium]|nr:DUF3568 family protein [Opitutaceae bacterium]
MKDQQRSLKKTVWFAMIVFGIVSQSLVQTGCVAVAVGIGAVGTVAYLKGSLTSQVNNSLDETMRATQIAVSELGLVSVSEIQGALDAELILRSAKDQKVSITLEKLEHQVTSVTIRIGSGGDEALSLTILEKIKGNL